MSATSNGIAAQHRGASTSQILLVVVALISALAVGAVIGRVSAPSATPPNGDRTEISTRWLVDPSEVVAYRVMERMNSLGRR